MLKNVLIWILWDEVLETSKDVVVFLTPYIVVVRMKIVMSDSLGFEDCFVPKTTIQKPPYFVIEQLVEILFHWENKRGGLKGIAILTSTF